GRKALVDLQLDGLAPLDVSQLARSQSLASGIYQDVNDEVGTGKLNFRFGATDIDEQGDYVGFEPNADNVSRSVTIDSSNNTLAGIRDAVNGADIGVQASLVDDGSGYRLLFSSAESGADNSMEISVDGDAGLDTLAFNADSQAMTQTVAAADAAFTVNGLNVSRGSNEVSGVIPGATLQLKDEGLSTINVSRDPSELSGPLQEFVDAYNGLKGVTDELTMFDPEAGDNGEGSLLTGDSLLRSMASDVQRMMRSSVAGLSGGPQSLAEIGITTDQDNEYQLQFDQATFNRAFNESPDDILALFATDGRTTDAQVQYSSAGRDTQPGTYDVEITGHATRGQYEGLGVAALDAGNIVIDDSNDRFVIDVNGTGAEITLEQGTYATADDLAQQIEAQINGHSRMVDNDYRVSVDYDAAGQRLELTSDRYGSESSIRFTDADAAVADTLGLLRQGEGPYRGNQLASLGTTGGATTDAFDTPVTLEADTGFTLNVGGETSTTITVPGDAATPVTYNTPQELIDAMQTEVDAAMAGTGKTVTVGFAQDPDTGYGRLTFTGNEASDRISVGATTDEAFGKLGLFDGNGAATRSLAGDDVEGLINGVEATGSGQYLRAASGNTPAQPGFYANGPYGDLSAGTASDSFRVEVDGVESGDITLGSFGNTDPDAVASAIQAAINNNTELMTADVSVRVEYDTNTGGFGIISGTNGASSSVRVTDLQGNAGDILGFALGRGEFGKAGADASGEPDPSAGLRLRVTGGPLGERGTATYIEGIAEQMNGVMERYLGPDGLLAGRDESLQREMREIAEERTALDERMQRSEERLRSSFLANDQIINRINADADFLSSQLQMLESLASPGSGDNQ
ncbi:MAG: flagellar filament capping protein FliD, partial [Pseudomonadota bacterium]